MKPLRRSVAISPPWSKFYAECAKHGMTVEQSEKFYSELSSAETWVNNLYVVTVDRSGEVGHISIRRQDRGAARDWRHFQQIKNELFGAESEAVELYPAESRVVDTANQFHLWVLPPGTVMPCGFKRGIKSEGTFIHSKQRPFTED